MSFGCVAKQMAEPHGYDIDRTLVERRTEYILIQAASRPLARYMAYSRCEYQENQPSSVAGLRCRDAREI